MFTYVCGNCGSQVIRKGRARTENVFCNTSCSATFNNKRYPKRGTVESRVCKQCGKDITRQYSNTGFCSTACHKEWSYCNYINKWLAGDVDGTKKGGTTLSNYVRRWLFVRAENKCELCGWNQVHPITGKIPLHIDHINGNWKDNKPENLRVLCPNCHSLTPTYGSLNIGNGRPYEITRKHRLINKHP